MYMRIAIFLTLIFSAGAAFAAWQFEPKIADQLQAAVSQVAPELIEAALLQGAEPRSRQTKQSHTCQRPRW